MTVAPFTSAELNDVRRFAGYPVQAAYLSSSLVVQGNSTTLDYILGNLTDDQITTVRTIYLANLQLLETDIMGARANLDTDRAAVWYHNKNELQDRIDLYQRTRMLLCYYLGIPPGIGIVPLVPAVFTV